MLWVSPTTGSSATGPTHWKGASSSRKYKKIHWFIDDGPLCPRFHFAKEGRETWTCITSKSIFSIYNFNQIIYSINQIIYSINKIIHSINQIIYSINQIIYSINQIIYSINQIIYSINQITLGEHEHEKYCGSAQPLTSSSATGPSHLERDQLISKNIKKN